MQSKAAAGMTELARLIPLERETLQERAYGQLREALMSGRFQPGHAITVRAAAAALGTSPMPVRGALHRLEAEGALAARDQRRTLIIPELTAGELYELRDMRVALEGLATEAAAVSIQSTEINAVHRYCKAMRAAAEAADVERYTRANWSFHATIYKAARMPRLLAVIESLWLRIGPYVSLMLPDQQTLLDSIPNHAEALAAIRLRDGSAARAAIAADITSCAGLLADNLGARSSESNTLAAVAALARRLSA